MALGMLFTSQGRIVLHGGDEIARSKPLAANDPNPDRAHTSSVVEPENGIRYFHENTYSSPDSTNQINWERAKQFSPLKNYIKGLIHLRRSTPAFRYLEAASVRKGLHFIGETSRISSPSYIAFTLDNTLENNVANTYKLFLVIYNSEDNDLIINIPEIKNTNKWEVLVDEKNSGIIPLQSSSVKIHPGYIQVPHKSIVVVGSNE
jgi:pullulanase